MNKIVAHRGFSSKRLGNTIQSFEKAFKEKYIDTIELDIRMTKDKKIVCIHDKFIKIKGNKKEYIQEKDYEELKKPILKEKDFLLELFKYASHVSSFTNLFRILRYRRKGTIPLLEDVLEKAPLNKEIMIEIKGKNSDYDGNTYEQEIIKVIDKHNDKKLTIIAFDEEILLSIKKKRPKLKVGLLIKKIDDNLDWPFEFILLSRKLVKYDLLKKLLEQKKEVTVWTVNTYSEYLLLKKESKDLFDNIGIVTDFPDLVYYLLKKK